MMKKKRAGVIAACVLVILCGAGILLAPQIRQMWSVAQSVSLDSEALAQKQEENRRVEQELREQYAMPEGDVSEEINAGVLDGSLSLEEAARQWLAQNQGADAADMAGQTETEAAGTDSPGTDGESASAAGGTDVGGAEAGGGAAAAESGTSSTEGNSGGTSANSSGNGASVSGGNENGASASGGAGNTEAVRENSDNASPAANGSGGSSSPAGNGDNSSVPAVRENAPASESPASPTANGDATAPGPTEDNPSNSGAAPAPKPSVQEEKDAKLQNLIAQTQILRSAFTGKLDSIVMQCKAEFLALDVDQQTMSNKVRIVTSRLGEVTALEAECDAQVASIVSQIRELDPDLADRAQNQYEEEKLAKKASLIDEYRNGPKQ